MCFLWSGSIVYGGGYGGPQAEFCRSASATGARPTLNPLPAILSLQVGVREGAGVLVVCNKLAREVGGGLDDFKVLLGSWGPEPHAFVNFEAIIKKKIV